MSKTIRKDYTKSKKDIIDTNKHRSRNVPSTKEGVEEWDGRTCECENCTCHD